jgi:hypothetical protein
MESFLDKKHLIEETDFNALRADAEKNVSKLQAGYPPKNL